MGRFGRGGRSDRQTALEATPLTRTPVVDQPRTVAPPPCMRRLQFPQGVHGDCQTDCPGRQEGNICLADVIRSAYEQNAPLSFDVKADPDVDPRWGGIWTYDGPPIDIREFESHQRDGAASMPVEPSSFVCPHCGHENTQDPTNFHWWCASCGKNAKNLEEGA